MGESPVKKSKGNRKEAIVGYTRNQHTYQAIFEVHEEISAPVKALCKIANISQSAYYKWRGHAPSRREAENKKIMEAIKVIHTAHPEKGYRRIRDDLVRDYHFTVNDKRVLRLCRAMGIVSIVKQRKPGCTKAEKHPAHTAENILNREFTATSPNQKWVTDVTEFKYYLGDQKHKLYLSAILDLYDRRLVAYQLSDRNNNELVFETFDQAVSENPEAHPLFHSDRGYQYTSPSFHERLVKAEMTQSMSRVGKCLDNGPMEGFWGILKRERYYGHRFTNRTELVEAIEQYIEYYNTQRYQRKLGILTPIEKHELYFLTVA